MHTSAGPQDPGSAWVLIGPTASGKTAVALELAEMEPIEIVSVDSMQVYRGMDVGTAKPTREERAAVPHHMIDVLEPEEPCSAGWFARRALAAMDDIRARGRRPLLVGGSPMYFKAILWGLDEGPVRDENVRRRLREEAGRLGGAALHERLAAVDPEGAARIHRNDVHRLVRALEVYEITGRPMDMNASGFDGPTRVNHVMVGLRRPRKELYSRINSRVDAMMDAGLLEETKVLAPRLGPQARHALGYRELCSYLAGETELDEAVRTIKRNTRRYAKHQMTWYSHFPQSHWIDIECGERVSEAARRAFNGLKTQP